MCKIFVAVHIHVLVARTGLPSYIKTQLPMSADTSARSYAGASPHLRQPNSHGPTRKATIDVKCSATWGHPFSEDVMDSGEAIIVISGTIGGVGR